MRHPLRRVLRQGPPGRESFSQSGEDMVVSYAFDVLGIAHPSYLDLGAHHPFELSNTAALYKAGSRGVNVEPEVAYHALFERFRPQDVNLNVGISDTPGSMPYYVLSAPTLSTFVHADMEQALERGFELVREVEVPVMTVTEVLDRHLPGGPDFLSLDTEGMDAVILQTLDFARHGPMVLCVENPPGSPAEVADIPLSHGYRPYAHTFINSIYVREDGWAEIDRSTVAAVAR